MGHRARPALSCAEPPAPNIAMQIAGESTGIGQLGETLAAVRAGTRTFVAVGAPFSSLVAREDGASYAFTLPAP